MKYTKYKSVENNQINVYELITIHGLVSKLLS